MSRELEKVNENEIDLLDLLKVIVVNKKVILITWLAVLVLGLSFGFYMKKNKSFEANRKFRIREVAYVVDSKETNLNIDPASLYDDQNFLDKLLGIDLLKNKTTNMKGLSESGKRDFVKRIFDVSKNNSDYVIKISGKDIYEVRELEKLYFKNLQEYLKNNYSNILNKDLELQKKNSSTFKNELLKLEKRINDLAKLSKGSYTAEDLKELYPTIFAEKEAISSVYTENYKAQKVIENSVAKLDELIVYQSTLNKVEDKMSIRLIFIISNVLGIFLGVFIVFVKEFLKGINWKELKQLSK